MLGQAATLPGTTITSLLSKVLQKRRSFSKIELHQRQKRDLKKGHLDKCLAEIPVPFKWLGAGRADVRKRDVC